MIVRLSDDSERDLVAGIKFYNRHGPEVGAYFRESLLSDIASLEILGGVHALRHGFHCMPAKRFPFAIYYTVTEQIVSIIAVLDERRNPRWIEQRLKNR